MTSKKLDLKSLYDEQHTEIPTGLLTGLDDALPDPMVHRKRDVSSLHWHVVSHGLVTTPIL